MTLLNSSLDGAQSPRLRRPLHLDTSATITSSPAVKTVTCSINDRGEATIPSSPVVKTITCGINDRGEPVRWTRTDCTPPRQGGRSPLRARLQSLTAATTGSHVQDVAMSASIGMSSPRSAHCPQLQGSLRVKPTSTWTAGSELQGQGPIIAQAAYPEACVYVDQAPILVRTASPERGEAVFLGQGSGVSARAISPRTSLRTTRQPFSVSARSASPRTTMHVQQGASPGTSTPVRVISSRIPVSGSSVVHTTSRATTPPPLYLESTDYTNQTIAQRAIIQPTLTIRRSPSPVRYSHVYSESPGALSVPLPQFAHLPKTTTIATKENQSSSRRASHSPGSQKVSDDGASSCSRSRSASTSRPTFIVPPYEFDRAAVVTPSPKRTRGSPPQSQCCTPPAHSPNPRPRQSHARNGPSPERASTKVKQSETVETQTELPADAQRVAALEVVCQGLRQTLVKRNAVNRELQTRTKRITASLEEREREVKELGEQLAKQKVTRHPEVQEKARSTRRRPGGNETPTPPNPTEAVDENTSTKPMSKRSTTPPKGGRVFLEARPGLSPTPKSSIK